ncbi:MAG: efflux RND transporter periplasmic adaptor subunit [Steroidobacteraceae bacterium]
MRIHRCRDERRWLDAGSRVGASWATGWRAGLMLALCAGSALAAAPDSTPLERSSGTLKQERVSAIVLPARVVAYQSAVITAKVAGYVKRIPVDTGDQVRAGDLIAELDVPELQADRLRYAAEAEVASRKYTRMLSAAKAAPDLVTPLDEEVQRGQVEVAQANLARIDALLRYSRVVAPFPGTITARYVDPGAFVPVPNGSNAQSGAIVTLMSLSNIRVQIPVPVADAPRIRPGCPAVITAPDLSGVRIAASVTRISHALSQKSQTMLAEIDMQNPHRLLLPGMYVSVRLTPGAEPQATEHQAAAPQP